MKSLSLSTELVPGERDAVLDWLRDYNHDRNGPFMQALAAGAEQEFFLAARDAGQNRVGGLFGVMLFDGFPRPAKG